MSSDIAKEYREYIELREKAKGVSNELGTLQPRVGLPKYDLETLYALRAVKGKDPSCDFSLVEGKRHPGVTMGPDGQPIPMSGDGEMPTTEDEWDIWYKLNEGIQSNSPMGLLVEKEKSIVAEGDLVARLAQLEEKIASTAAKLGVSFDPETGDMQIDPSAVPPQGEEIGEEIEDLAAELGMKRVSAPIAKAPESEISDGDEIPMPGQTAYRTVVEPRTQGEELDQDDDIGEIGVSSSTGTSTATSGSANPSQGREEKEPEPENPPSIKALANEVMRRPALLREINAMKEEILDRDVKAQKILDARRAVEVAKDAMDMDAAIYAAQKYRMQMEIAAMKIAVLRAMEQGRPHEAENLKRGIADVHARMMKLEGDFARRAESHQVELEGKISNLETAQKEFQLADSKDTGLKESIVKYSEAGILQEMGVQVDVSGRPVNERMVVDERGILVDDVADVISKTTSYNIEGTVVVRHSSVETDNDVTDEFQIDGKETLQIDEEGISEAEYADASISREGAIQPPLRSVSDPDFDVRRDLGRVNKQMNVAMYAYAGAIAGPMALASLAPEALMLLRDAGITNDFLGKLDVSRKGAHPETRGMSLRDWVQGIGDDLERFAAGPEMEAFFAKLLQRQQEQEDPNFHDPSEIPFQNPYADNNN